jgi:hypothetical protein
MQERHHGHEASTDQCSRETRCSEPAELCVALVFPVPHFACRLIEFRELYREKGGFLPSTLVDLLLLVHAQLAGAHVDQEKQTTTANC